MRQYKAQVNTTPPPSCKSSRVITVATLLLMLLSPVNSVFAITVRCSPGPGSAEEQISMLRELLSDYDIVANVSYARAHIFGVTELSVERLWKGVTGEHIFINGYDRGTVLFAKRTETPGPFQDYAWSEFCSIPTERPNQFMTALFGEGYLPSSSMQEYSYSPFYFLIELAVVALASVGVSIMLWNWARQKTDA